MYFKTSFSLFLPKCNISFSPIFQFSVIALFPFLFLFSLHFTTFSIIATIFFLDYSPFLFVLLVQILSSSCPSILSSFFFFFLQFSFSFAQSLIISLSSFWISYYWIYFASSWSPQTFFLSFLRLLPLLSISFSLIPFLSAYAFYPSIYSSFFIPRILFYLFLCILPLQISLTSFFLHSCTFCFLSFLCVSCSLHARFSCLMAPFLLPFLPIPKLFLSSFSFSFSLISSYFLFRYFYPCSPSRVLLLNLHIFMKFPFSCLNLSFPFITLFFWSFELWIISSPQNSLSFSVNPLWSFAFLFPVSGQSTDCH